MKFHIRHLNNSFRNHIHGFSMIEVLVTLMVLSIGLLGLAAMQTSSIQNTHGAYLRTQATHLAYDILDRMRANMTGVNDGDYNNINANESVNNYTDPNCFTAGCTSLQMTATDAAQWEIDLATQLPAGQGTVVVDPAGNNVFTITVTWGDPDTGGTINFVMTSQL